MRAKIDSLDLLQSAFKSFFRRQAGGHYRDLDSWDELWALLVTITVHKCEAYRKYFRAARRAIDREVSREILAHSLPEGWEPMDPEPPPDEVVLTADLIEYLVRRSGGDRNRAIIECWLEGYTAHEISEKTGRTERTVGRVLERLRDLLRRLQEETERGGEAK